MANFNRVILVGRLTKDPELKYTPSGMQVARFSIAVNRVRSKNDEVDFFNIVAFQKLAEICVQYLKKGKLVLVEGRIQIRNYTTQDGQKRTATEIIMENLQMLDSKAADGKASPTAPAGFGAPAIEEISPDDLGVDEFDAADMPF